MLALPGVRERLEQSSALRVAVSPIVGDAAVKGPAAKIMAELGLEVSCAGIAELYKNFCDVLLIDHQDSHYVPAIERLGVKPVVASIIMVSEADKVTLAELVLGMGAA